MKKIRKKIWEKSKKNLGVPKKSENERNSKKNVGVQKKNLGVPKKSENEKNPKKIWGHKFLCKVQKNSLYNTQKSANLKCFKYCPQEYSNIEKNVQSVLCSSSRHNHIWTQPYLNATIFECDHIWNI